MSVPELDVYVVTHHSSTQAPTFVDLKRDPESAMRRATMDAGRPLSFEQTAPDTWQARGANRRIYMVRRHVL
jgi:hypothetical protein